MSSHFRCVSYFRCLKDRYDLGKSLTRHTRSTKRAVLSTSWKWLLCRPSKVSPPSMNADSQPHPDSEQSYCSYMAYNVMGIFGASPLVPLAVSSSPPLSHIP